MKKVVIFTYGNYSHNLCVRNIISDLLKDKSKVYVFGKNEYKHMYKEFDVEFIPYEEHLKDRSKEKKEVEEYARLLDENNDEKHLHDYIVKIHEFDFKKNLEQADNVIKKVEEISPDLIIRDSCMLCGKIVGDRLNIKTIGYICNICVTKEMIMNNPVELLSTSWAYDMGSYGKKGCIKFYNTLETDLKEICREYNIPAFPVIYTLDPGEEFNIVFSSNLFQHDLNSNYKVCRYDLFNQDMTIRQESKEDLVYMSFGTVVKGNIYLIISIMEALRDSKFKLLISAKGLKEDLDELDYEVPKNVQIESFVDQKKVLEKAKLFISHGGYNSICESIYYEVPLIICAISADQFNNAKIIDKLGIGVDIRRIKVNSPNIQKLCKLLIENKSIINNIKLVKASFKDKDNIKDILKVVFNE